MMARRRTLGLLLGGAVALLGGCGLVTNHPAFRYRVTIEVDTPQGLRSGSSVIEVRAGEVGTTLGGAGVEVSGEAVAVDLPGGQTLFALLRGEAENDWAGRVMFDVTPRPRSEPGQEKKSFGRRIEAILDNHKLNVVPRMKPAAFDADPPISGYPIMVGFMNIKDPKTVVRVDPDNLAGSFGDGVKLRRITVQLTDDAMTTGIEKKLPSFGPETGFDEWLGTLAHSDPRRIFLNDFRKK